MITFMLANIKSHHKIPFICTQMQSAIRYRRARITFKGWLKHDLSAGLSVFLVAIPLCLGIALASGAPLISGLISGIVGGIVVTLISGSQLGVSGPAAGLTTLMISAIAATGSFSAVLLSIIVAGLMQILLGIFRLGKIANYFPSAVLKGMLAAIGILLMLKQLPTAMGYSSDGEFYSDGLWSMLAGNDFRSAYHEFSLDLSRGAFIIALVAAAILMVFRLPQLRKIRIVPPALLAVLAGIGLNLYFTGSDYFSGMRHAALVDLPENPLESLILPDHSLWLKNPLIYQYGILIGLLASLETLLCAEAVDKLDPQQRRTPLNRELIAQGAGNIVSGLIGGLPITAVIVRGSANIEAGARTKMSSLTHGVFLFIATALLTAWLEFIPLAALSAILLLTGYQLTRPSLYKRMYKLGWDQFLPFVITVISILFTDLLIGVSIGLAASVYFIIRRSFKQEFHLEHGKKHETQVYTITLRETVTFLNKAALRELLEQVPPYAELTIDGTRNRHIDYDVIEMLSEFHVSAKQKHIEVTLLGIETVGIESAAH
jgi:MFS superfamily sulfate permease-like transporter